MLLKTATTYIMWYKHLSQIELIFFMTHKHLANLHIVDLAYNTSVLNSTEYLSESANGYQARNKPASWRFDPCTRLYRSHDNASKVCGGKGGEEQGDWTSYDWQGF